MNCTPSTVCADLPTRRAPWEARCGKVERGRAAMMVGDAILEAWERRDAAALDALLVQRHAAGQVRAAVQSWRTGRLTTGSAGSTDVGGAERARSGLDKRDELVLSLSAALCRRIRTRDLAEHAQIQMLCVWFTALVTEHLDLFTPMVSSTRAGAVGGQADTESEIDEDSAEHGLRALAHECRMLYADLAEFSALGLDQSVRRTIGRLELLGAHTKHIPRQNSAESESSSASTSSSGSSDPSPSNNHEDNTGDENDSGTAASGSAIDDDSGGSSTE
ncbi:hypothetical protein FVE85_7556 [Porphyridium purpureum]|uniref:Uncharacterized protein n=1 Tax=Porphyridium purpureum TaxID=35688 RepID=A0A5J4Z7M1_PORPP|nr:hypothetical protein FVE85_7556 [Porphyridium purpureum]|eukprot:POR2288..scf295_1